MALRIASERNPDMKPITLFTLLFSLSAGLSASASAQTAMAAKNRICIDVAHQQRFWAIPQTWTRKGSSA